jgi:glycerol-3-phosphate acyltransferase PlsY
VFAAYLAGSIPCSYLVARARGVDLRTVGSGNIGASNVWRSCGFPAFVTALSGDLLKGFLPTYAAHRLLGEPHWIVAVGIAAILGHTFPIFLGFRGGKAVATSGGVLLALAPILAIAGVLVWGVVLRLTRLPALGSLSAVGAIVPASILLLAQGTLPLAYAGFIWLAAILIIYLHRANIRRLLAGRENRV